MGPVSQSPVTNYVTHTSTYVTTITTEDSTELPITFRGREGTTTIVESSTQVITATEFSTETVIQQVAVPITPAPAAPPDFDASGLPGFVQEIPRSDHNSEARRAFKDNAT